MSITIEQTSISECIVIRPTIHRDERGVFSEIYKYSDLHHFKPIQSNCSISKGGVLRGIHRAPYAKLVTCVKGRVYDVCVDLRPDSDTYLKYFGIELDGDSLMSLYIPSYCGHGFLAIQDSIVIYHQNEEYSHQTDETYCYKSYNIPWPLLSNPIISKKDSNVCN